MSKERFENGILSASVRQHAGWVLALLLGTTLVYQWFPASGNDDSYITYWSSYALSEFGRLANYNGVAIEQSSSLLLVATLAGLRSLFGIEPHHAGPILSAACAAMAVVAVAWLSRLAELRCWFAPPLFLSVSLPFLYWSTSGMEASLAALLVVVAIGAIGATCHSVERQPRGAVIIGVVTLLGIALVRPETHLVFLGALTCLVLAQLSWDARFPDPNRRARNRALAWMGVLVAATLAVMGWRLHTFGSPFPNSAMAKTGAFHLTRGVSYLAKSYRLSGVTAVLVAAIGLGSVLWRCMNRRVSPVLVLCTASAVLQTAFVCQSGGDWMPAGRLLVPAAPAMAILAGAGLELALQRVAWAVWPAALGLVCYGGLSVGRFAQQRGNASLPSHYVLTDAEQRQLAGKYGFFEVHNRGHRRDAWVIENLLPAIRERVAASGSFVLMSGQAGMVPYYVFRQFFGSGRFLDLYSLTSREHLACFPPEQTTHVVQGVLVSARFALRVPNPLDACGFARPDIWFSTGTPPDSLQSEGFRLIYQSEPGADSAWAAVAKAP